MYTLKFRLSLQSDWHIAAAEGDGANCDSLLLRGKDGQPLVPGTTLSGLFLAAANQLREMGFLTEAARDKVFGSPAQEKTVIFSNAAVIGKASEYSDSYTNSTVRRRVRMDNRTRTRQTGMLYAKEEGRPLEFSFAVECADTATASLIVALARLIRGLGSGRRRGLGNTIIALEECSCGAKKLNQSEMLAIFEKYWLKGEELPPESRTPKQFKTSAADDDAPINIRLVVRLDSPLLIAVRSTAGNEFGGADYINASTLRGAMVQKMLSAIGSDALEIKEEYSWFVKNIVRGGIGWSDLYPVKLCGDKGDKFMATIPVPQDIMVCKYGDPFKGKNKENHSEFALSKGEKEFTCKCGNALRQKGGFMVLGDETDIIAPSKIVAMHNRIADSGTTDQDGGLYSYQPLVEGQIFAGDIRTTKAAWTEFCVRAELPGEKEPFVLRMGKGRLRGYGQVSAYWEYGSKRNMWLGVDTAARVKAGDKKAVITLLSDTILLDAWGRYAAGIDSDLGVLQEALVGLPTIEKIEFASGKSKEVDGFNRHIGLPRRRDIAVAAGSVVCLHFAESLSAAHIAAMSELEHSGIGLRRSEGFGLIAFNHPLYNERKALGSCKYTLAPCFVEVKRDGKPKAWLEKQFNKAAEQYVSREMDAIKITKYAGMYEGLSRYLLTQDYKNLDGITHDLKEILGMRNLPIGNNKMLGDALKESDKQGFYQDESKGKHNLDKLQSIIRNAAQEAFWTKFKDADLSNEFKVKAIVHQAATQLAVLARCAAKGEK